MKYHEADEYLAVPTWLSALGLHYTQVAKIMGHMDANGEWVFGHNPESVEHRDVGHVPHVVAPIKVPTLLGEHMANRIPGSRTMSDPVLATLIDARNAKWIKQLEDDVKQSRERREGLKATKEPKETPAETVKRLLATYRPTA